MGARLKRQAGTYSCLSVGTARGDAAGLSLLCLQRPWNDSEVLKIFLVDRTLHSTRYSTTYHR